MRCILCRRKIWYVGEDHPDTHHAIPGTAGPFQVSKQLIYREVEAPACLECAHDAGRNALICGILATRPEDRS